MLIHSFRTLESIWEFNKYSFKDSLYNPTRIPLQFVPRISYFFNGFLSKFRFIQEFLQFSNLDLSWQNKDSSRKSSRDSFQNSFKTPAGTPPSILREKPPGFLHSLLLIFLNFFGRFSWKSRNVFLEFRHSVRPSRSFFWFIQRYLLNPSVIFPGLAVKMITYLHFFKDWFSAFCGDSFHSSPAKTTPSGILSDYFRDSFRILAPLKTFSGIFINVFFSSEFVQGFFPAIIQEYLLSFFFVFFFFWEIWDFLETCLGIPSSISTWFSAEIPWGEG